ncbi:hypothetical protein QBE52_05635 [Clostridiaceae bacterium 35-E11]
MKRYSMVLLVFVMGLALAACSQWTMDLNGRNANRTEESKSRILTAKVMDIDGTSILLADMTENADQGGIYSVNVDKTDIIRADGSTLDSSVLRRGMLVDVAYDGSIQESFPMELGGITDIYIKEQGDDIVGLYKTVVDDLYAVDSGLNSGAEILAFDLTGVSNLSQTEKIAFIYLLGNTYKKQTMKGTFEELCEQGYIDKDKLYFKKGLLFTIKDTELSGGRFTFDARKWRSGLGAYFYIDCTAKKTSAGWNYTIGSEAIS